MSISKLFFFSFILLVSISSCTCLFKQAQCIKNYAKINTTKGEFVVGLYEGTAKHRDNFIHKSLNSYYDSLLVYEVLPNSTISFGLEKELDEQQILRRNYPDSTIAPEFNEQLINKKYAVGMKRLDDNLNPNKRSDGQLFYIVKGMIVEETLMNSLVNMQNSDQLRAEFRKYINRPENKEIKDSLDLLSAEGMADEYQNLRSEITNMLKDSIVSKDETQLFYVSDNNRKVYADIGGVPVYDNKYSVFGEVSAGFDVIKEIYQTSVDFRRNPREEIYILSTEILNRREFKRYLRSNN